MAASCRNPKPQRDPEVDYAIKTHLQLLGYHSSITQLKSLHFLFCQLDSAAARLTFRNCWPAHDRKQEAEFRKLCRNWLQSISDNEPDVMIPKQVGSILMNPESRAFQKLLFGLCRYVMSKILAREGVVGMQEYTTVSNSAIHCVALQTETSANLTEFKKGLVQINKCSQAQEYADAMVCEYNRLVNSSEAFKRQALELSQKSSSLKQYYDSWTKARASGDVDAMRSLKAEAIVQRHEPLFKICDILRVVGELPASPSPSIAAITSRSDDTVALTAEPVIFKDATQSVQQLRQHLSTVNFDIFNSARTITEAYCKDAEDFLKAVEEVNVKMGVEQIPDSRASIREMRSHRASSQPYLVIDPPSPISSESDEDEMRYTTGVRLDVLHHTPILGEKQGYAKNSGSVTRTGFKSSSKPKRIPSPLLKDPFADDFQHESEVELKIVGDKQCTTRKKSSDESLMPKYLCGAPVNMQTSTPFITVPKSQFSLLPRPVPQFFSRNDASQQEVSVRPKQMKRPIVPCTSPGFYRNANYNRSPGFQGRELNVRSEAVDEVVNEVLGLRSSPITEKLRSPQASPKPYQNGSVSNSIELDLEDVNLSEIITLLDSPFKCPKRRRRSRSAEPIRTKSTDKPRIRSISGDQDELETQLDTDLPNMLSPDDVDNLVAQDFISYESDSLLLPSSPY